jgi:heat shock protein HslJ
VRTVVSILGLVLIVTGCATAGTSSPGIRIEGVDWRAVTIAGQQPIPHQAPGLRLVGSTITGSGGCNGFSGNARVENGRLVVDHLAMTAMACLDDRANERERQFIAILSSQPRIGTRDGRLVLAGDGGEIVLEAPGIFVGPTD